MMMGQGRIGAVRPFEANSPNSLLHTCATRPSGGVVKGGGGAPPGESRKRKKRNHLLKKKKKPSPISLCQNFSTGFFFEENSVLKKCPKIQPILSGKNFWAFSPLVPDSRLPRMGGHDLSGGVVRAAVEPFRSYSSLTKRLAGRTLVIATKNVSSPSTVSR